MYSSLSSRYLSLPFPSPRFASRPFILQRTLVIKWQSGRERYSACSIEATTVPVTRRIIATIPIAKNRERQSKKKDAVWCIVIGSPRLGRNARMIRSRRRELRIISADKSRQSTVSAAFIPGTLPRRSSSDKFIRWAWNRLAFLRYEGPSASTPLDTARHRSTNARKIATAVFGGRGSIDDTVY